MITRGTERVSYSDLLMAEVKIKGQHYWATQVDVRDLNYKACVAFASSIAGAIKVLVMLMWVQAGAGHATDRHY